MKRFVLWVCALMMTLMASVCVAGTYSPYFTTEPPREVREHVASRWPDILKNGDPYYNPNLTLRKSDFSLRDLLKEKIGEPYKLPDLKEQ